MTLSLILKTVGSLISSAASTIIVRLLIERFTRISRGWSKGYLALFLALALLFGLFLTGGGASPPGPSVPPVPPSGQPTGPAGPTIPVPTTTSPPPPPPAAVLPYHANWSNGLDGWGGSAEWATTNGMLVNTGQGQQAKASIVAPLDLSSTDSYAVDADIQLVRYTDEGMFSAMDSFGVVVRVQDDGTGYGAGHCVSSGIFSCSSNQPDDHVAVLWTASGSNPADLDIQQFRPGTGYHHYRVEVRGNRLTVLIDGAAVLNATDNSYLGGKRVGLWSDHCQINVRSFAVSAI
ncbi:MAG TPA: family 16 glycoside hydrolase [Pseudonocardiaceae bacterium]|nr:family 16 glycoside hydrolase [Pseudonocardiaceae bacterium]